MTPTTDPDSNSGSDSDSTTVVPPTRRSCERCGRKELWHEDRATWTAADNRSGLAYCLHEWDITGTYNPLVEPE
ncbi:MAG: hypothetical protein J07HX5_01215 [halophilic archaeon J07HX5]|nr:MAG: hypothetical protein J07HX5_01215 [halophilic archaeon J07HX5]